MKLKVLAVSLLAVANLVFLSSDIEAGQAPQKLKETRYQPRVLKQPTHQNRVLLVDNFNYPNMMNLLGGETQGDEEEPGGLIPSYTPSGRLTMGEAGHSLKMDYNVAIPMAIAYYWTRLGPVDSEVVGATFPIDLEGFNYLSFWIKTDREYPRFAIEFHQDVNNDHIFTLGKDTNNKIAVSSFILSPAEKIAGGAAEVIVDVKDKRILVESRKKKKPKVEEELKPQEEEKEEDVIETASLSETPDEAGEMIEVMSPPILPGGEVLKEEKTQTTERKTQEEAAKEPEIQEVKELEEKKEETAKEAEPEKMEEKQEKADAEPKKEEKPEDISGKVKEEEKTVEAMKRQKPSSLLRLKKYKRRSRKRVTFFHTEGPATSPEKEVSRRELEVSRRKAPKKRAVEIEVGSTVVSRAVVTTVLGKGTSIQAPTQIRAMRKKDLSWRKVVVPLSRFRGITDWSKILEMIFLFSDQLASDQGIIYVDDILFGTNYMHPKPEKVRAPKIEFLKFAKLKENISPAVIRGIQMASRKEENQAVHKVSEEALMARDVSGDLLKAQLNSREKIINFFKTEDAENFIDGARLPNTFLLYFKTSVTDPTLETIRVETSQDEGVTWSIISNLYSHQEDGVYIFPWRLPSTGAGESILFRLNAADIWGRAAVMGEPIKFQVGGASE